MLVVDKAESTVIFVIVGLLVKSLYEPEVATAAKLGLLETFTHATEAADPDTLIFHVPLAPNPVLDGA